MISLAALAAAALEERIEATVALALDIVEAARRAHALPVPRGGGRGGRRCPSGGEVRAGGVRRRRRTRSAHGGPARVTATLMQTPP